jgi:hypothetical protein
MKTEVTIQNKDALEALKLINEYLLQGGIGFDHDALERFAEALSEADSFVIVPAYEADQ